MRALLFVIVVAAVAATGCGSTAGGSGAIRVVAAENFWGSIASQLGGSKANVQSVVTDPNADPHEYESSANDARAFADSNLVILNGAGYDDWGKKLIDANPSTNRRVTNVAELLGKKVGDNPHFWYDPGYVQHVADAITADYRSIDPADASYFDQQRAEFAKRLGPFIAKIASIKREYTGVAVGSTESIFAYMAAALGVNLTTSVEFMDAVAEGNDPPADAVVRFQNQISSNQIKVLVYNVQTTNAVTTNIRTLAASHHIPSIGVSETLQPENVSFEDWQLAQLASFEEALKSTT